MEKDGLLIAEWQMSTGQTPRKYYEISPQGREKLAGYRQFMAGIYKQIGGVV
jgi:DNA-binding PadR family transcriptional regulator